MPGGCREQEVAPPFVPRAWQYSSCQDCYYSDFSIYNNGAYNLGGSTRPRQGISLPQLKLDCFSGAVLPQVSLFDETPTVRGNTAEVRYRVGTLDRISAWLVSRSGDTTLVRHGRDERIQFLCDLVAADGGILEVVLVDSAGETLYVEFSLAGASWVLDQHELCC